ncbi:MAG TPA: OB-fold nucleic acid binding domain-containing protein, partial [Coleofasciculaceae cyanobacterium]
MSSQLGILGVGTLKKVSYFTLEGRFVSFVSDFKENPKRIQVATAKGEFYIKLSKELRHSLREALEPGDWVQIFGEQKLKYKTGELKLKAFQLKIIAPVQRQQINTAETEGVPETSESCPQIPTLQSSVEQ